VADYVGKSEDGRQDTELARDILHTASRKDLEDPLEDTLRWNSQTYRNGEATRIVDRSVSLLSRLKRVMWDDVGLVRTPRGLDRALESLEEIGEEAEELYRRVPCAETAGLRDASGAGREVAVSARMNRVSKGAHTIVLSEQPEQQQQTAAAAQQEVELVRKDLEEAGNESDEDEELLGAGFAV